MIISIVFVIIVVMLLYLILPTILILTIKNVKILKILSLSLFCLFLCILFIGVFSQIEITKDIVNISFINDGLWCDAKVNWSFQSNFVDYLINVFMLFPVGAIIIMLNYFGQQKKFIVCILLSLLIGFCFGIFIETMQYILPINRTVQLSDVVLNGISVLIGGMFYYLVFKLRMKYIFVNKK